MIGEIYKVTIYYNLINLRHIDNIWHYQMLYYKFIPVFLQTVRKGILKKFIVLSVFLVLFNVLQTFFMV